jgi:hypothetical protein
MTGDELTQLGGEMSGQGWGGQVGPLVAPWGMEEGSRVTAS